MAGSIRQTVTFDAKPAVVFEALMDSRTHARFTGAPAAIGRSAGSAFSAFGRYAVGYTVHVVENRSVVQAWRGSDWPKGVYSIASFTLAPARGGKTRLTFEQHGVPAEHRRSIANGWKDFYWKPLKAMLKAEAKAKPAPGRKAARRTRR